MAEDPSPENHWKKLLLALSLVLSQAPIVGSIYLIGLEAIKNNPVLAALLGIAYEALVFLFAFGKKVWAKLEGKAVEYVADWLWRSVTGFAPGFRRRYKKQMIRDHGLFNVRGLGLINTYTLKLEEVFVDLRIAPSANPGKPNFDPFALKAISGNRPVWDFFRIKKRKEDDAIALAVIGPPGCGKTTLLRHVALTLAGNRQRRYRSRAYTPVFLLLRDHVAAITQENPPALAALAQTHFSNATLYPTLKTPAHWFEKQIEGGKSMILLDGLDEIADAEKRRAVAAWIDNQIRNYPHCQFIVTARPQGYRTAPLDRASVVLEVQNFNAQQVRKFVDNWYLANEIKSSGDVTNDEVRHRAAKDARDLLQRLRALPALSMLTANPLLLTMIAMVHRYRGALPGSRVELYANICDVLLSRWQKTKGLPDALSAAQKLLVLQPLAATMMKLQTRNIETDQAVAVIKPLLKRVGFADQAENFLSDLESGSALFLEREPGRWSFAHLTFQEYLTAAHWLEQKSAPRNWGTMVEESWMHETLRLYAAQGDATALVRACLEKDSVAALSLAADCLEEARELDNEVRRATMKCINDDLTSSEAARRRLAAEVQICRRLKTLQPIDDTRAIDVKYVTCAEYQLFLDDRRAEGKYHQPDHWKDFHFELSQATEPVAGGRAEDAAAFCEWLTGRFGGGEVTYRLPFANEATEFPANPDTLAMWCRKDADFVLRGLAATTEQEIRKTLANISGATLPLLNSLDLDLDLARDLALDRALDRALDLDRARALAFDLARAGFHKEEAESRSIAKAIEDNNLPEATRLSKLWETHSDKYIARQGTLLCDLLAAATADTAVAVRFYRRKYTVHLLEYAYEGYEELKRIHLPSLRQRLFRRRRELEEVVTKQNLTLELYWWVQIVLAREEGKLTAWEGIRFVREFAQADKAE